MGNQQTKYEIKLNLCSGKSVFPMFSQSDLCWPFTFTKNNRYLFSMQQIWNQSKLAFLRFCLQALYLTSYDLWSPQKNYQGPVLTLLHIHTTYEISPITLLKCHIYKHDWETVQTTIIVKTKTWSFIWYFSKFRKSQNLSWQHYCWKKITWIEDFSDSPIHHPQHLPFHPVVVVSHLRWGHWSWHS